MEKIAALNRTILRSIVDHAVVTLDADGIVTSWNEGAERILGWTEDEIVGRSADVFFTADDVDKDRPETEMRRAIEDGRAEDVRWHVPKDGEKFWGSGLMMPFLDGTDLDGDAIQDPKRIEGFVKIFRDRMVEREADQRMARLQDRATLAMQRSGTVGVFDIDLQNDLIITDHVCARMHSVDIDAAEGGTTTDVFFDGIVEEDREDARAVLRATLKDAQDSDVIYRVISDQTRPRWIHFQGRVHLKENGDPERLTGIVVDVTEQQEHLRMKEARLEFAEKVRDIDDAAEIAELASRVIGETLYASRVGHGYVDADGDTIDIQADWNSSRRNSIVGTLKFSDFGSFVSELHEGKEVVISDAEADPRVEDASALASIDIRSLVNLPLIEQGKLKAVLFVNDTETREWSEAELTFLGAMFDRTYAAIDVLRFEKERDILAIEIAHRMKNMLAIAQIIVKQSLRNTTDTPAAQQAIDARLRALSGAQDVLTRAEEKTADILSVIETSLAPHVPQQSRVEFFGPSIPMTSDQVLGLTLALHELATNASKYGALSNNVGHIRIAWDVDEEGAFMFRWVEQDGPEVKPPTTEGFGSTILKRIVGSYFSGSSLVSYDRDGIKFELRGNL
ncbi:HWE histidine kinase domain-containing protein [Aestuariibius insulae]|uniref:HWE histidine kinase domain-containing protein n=1 Tax=Aestuariibius insulae TaxID=2058287 RepID=UPI00345E8D78